MNYCGMIDSDVANGEGVRISLFVSGCTHHCKNCFNKDAWDFDYGEPFTLATEEKIFKMLEPSYIKGLTLLGGEPMEPKNQEGLYSLIKHFRERFGHTKDIWCFSGFVYDKDLVRGGRAYTDKTDYLLDNIDVLVDGPFIEELHSHALKFRGSSNQRIIDLNKTRHGEELELYMA